MRMFASVISRLILIYFTITGVEKMFRYIEDSVIWFVLSTNFEAVVCFSCMFVIGCLLSYCIDKYCLD